MPPPIARFPPATSSGYLLLARSCGLLPSVATSRYPAVRCATSWCPASVATRRPLPWERRTWGRVSTGYGEKMGWGIGREIALPGSSLIAVADAALLLVYLPLRSPPGIGEEKKRRQGRRSTAPIRSLPFPSLPWERERR